MILYTALLVASVLLLLLIYDPHIGFQTASTTDNTTTIITSGVDTSTYQPNDVINCDSQSDQQDLAPGSVTSLPCLTTNKLTDDSVDNESFFLLYTIDRGISLLFFLEIFLRFAVSPSKMNFLRDKYHMVDIIGIIPRTLIDMLIFMSPKNVDELVDVEWLQVYIRISSVLRVVRLISASRHFIASRVFLITLWESRKEILLLLSLYTAGGTFYAVAVYYCERDDNNEFPTMASGIWWALITMATVGYGDMVPKTELGKTIGVMCAFSGVISTGLPVAVIAHNYNIIYRIAKVRAKLRLMKAKEL